MKKNKKFLAVTLATSIVAGSLGGSFTAQAETSAQDATIQLTDAEIAELSGEESLARTSVHDPSVVKTGDTYYIFGSHMAVSKTQDLQNWTSVTGESTTSTLFGTEENGVVSVASYEQAFLNNAYTGKVTALVNGEEVEVDFGENYDIAAWISDNTIQGNMWAPDVIYNQTLGKWCMYQSLNGAKWNSAVVLLTADDIEGPYVYQGPVVFTGFSTTDSTKSFKNTDIELVIGEQEELPEKYQKISDGSWGTYWPHAIDPAVFYDDEGDLWMTYGSWSGGIYMLELDEETGLRDYTVTYEDNFDTLGASVTSDPYFGTKIAGGYYVSGEGPYIEKIEDYYYLFMSYGFYSPEGGYNMRVFRSENPDGPYVDANGASAIFNKYIHNYNAVDKYNNYGVKLMGNYQWSTMNKAEVAQGHNSAFVDDDGKAYVVYHTKFNDGTAGHEVRVHQLYVNSQGWLAASPYEYSGETISATGYSKEEIAGTYGMITHEYQINFGDLEYQSPETIVLNADGTVTGTYTGTWSTTAGSADATLVLDGKTYYGMFTEEVIDGTTIETMGFTFVSEDGLSIWGTKELGDSIAVAQTVTSGVQIPTKAYQSFTLPTEGESGAKIAWSSSNEAVLSATGEVTRPSADTTVTMTAKIYKGEYFYEKDYQVLVYAGEQSAEESITIAEYFTGESKDLSTGLDASISIPNPFYKDVTAVDISGGVTIEFDAVSTGDVHVLGTILSFMGDKGGNGRLYFTPGSYLGYNANGAYFDANLLNYGLVTDYIGEKAHVEINIHNAGFTVTVNDEVAYTEEILTTDVGAGTVTNYKSVLNWLQNTADTLYFGYGSWWNAAGYDEANVEISNVVFSVGPVSSDSADDDVQEPAKTSAEYTKDEVVLATNDALTVEENPFYGVSAEKVELAYTINFTEGTAQNGWDGIFSFYNSTTDGRVSVQTAPYVCYNDADGNWMDINQPGSTGGSNMAASAVPGEEYEVVITITEEGMVATVDGEEVTLGIAGSGAGYDDLLAFLGECDQLTWGVGLASTAYWNTELCTITDIEFTAGSDDASDDNSDDTSSDDATDDDTVEPFESATYTREEVVLTSADAITMEDSPFYGLVSDKVLLEYTINFTEGTPQLGWDGIFSFYNSKTGGRVSIQTAPYVCYNDADGNWMDINQPGSTNGSNMALEAVPGEEYKVTILMTNEGVEATVNGEVVSLGLAGSGAGYDDMLAFLGECDQLTWGVGLAQTAYWNTELCTLTDIKFTAGEDVVLDIPDEDTPTTDQPGEDDDTTGDDDDTTGGDDDTTGDDDDTTGDDDDTTGGDDNTTGGDDDTTGDDDDTIDGDDDTTGGDDNTTGDDDDTTGGDDDTTGDDDDTTGGDNDTTGDDDDTAGGDDDITGDDDDTTGGDDNTTGGDDDTTGDDDDTTDGDDDTTGDDDVTDKDDNTSDKDDTTPSKPAQKPQSSQSSNKNQSSSNKNQNSNNNASSSSQTSSKPVAVKKPVVVIFDEIVPLAHSVQAAGFNYVDVILNQKAAMQKSEVLKKYYGRNLQVMIHLGNGLGFSIDGTSLTAAKEKAMFGTTVNILDNFAPEFVTMHVSPAKEQILDQPIGIHLHVGTEYIGDKAYIYAKNLETGVLEFKQMVDVNSIGNITLFTNEVSDVVVMLHEAK